MKTNVLEISRFSNENIPFVPESFTGYKNCTDVTIVSDELMIHKVHKSVLSASSKVLKQILVDNPHEHPLIYLNGVRESELQSLLQLMYKGETKYKKGQREPFLKLIQHLEMPGLIFPRETNLFINKLSYYFKHDF